MNKEIDFKTAIDELETINEWFQKDDIDLDEGIKKLKKAKELISVCRGKLSEVENEFTTLKEEFEIEKDTSYTPSSRSLKEEDEETPF